VWGGGNQTGGPDTPNGKSGIAWSKKKDKREGKTMCDSHEKGRYLISVGGTMRTNLNKNRGVTIHTGRGEWGNVYQEEGRED